MDNAGLYIRANPMQTKDAEESLQEFSRTFMWGKREKILDVGCGPGDVTTNILKKFIPEDATLIGGDVSSEMISYATSKFQNEQIMFRLLDIENVSEDLGLDGSFDKIFSFYCFHWIRNKKTALKNMFNLLKPCGEIFLIFLARVPVFDLYKLMSADDRWAHYMTDIEKFISEYHDLEQPEEHFHKALFESNFRNINVKRMNKSFSYSTIEQLVSSIVAVNPFIKRIPAHLQSSYKDDIARYALQMTNQVDGLIEVGYSLIVAHASK